MKKILLIATGGTIASKKTEFGLVPNITSEEILSCVPEILKFCLVDTVQLFNLDSTNIKYSHWIKIVECIKLNYKTYDGFVITHGTDTMAYTAAAISYMIQNSKKPIVITGSQKSIYKKETDARKNLLDSFIYASDNKACGVHIVFDGKVIIGTRARKIRTKSYNAFSSIDYPEVAVIRDKRLIYYIEEKIPQELPIFYENINSNVFAMKLIPGIKPNIFEYLKQNYHAVVIESFGVGGIPFYEDKGFIHAIEDFIQSGKIIIMTTQVPYEGSDMSVYEVGHFIKKQYQLIEAYNMTIEAVVTKLMWILGQTQNPDSISKMFYTPIQKDIIV